jgi:hypothetical protein
LPTRSKEGVNVAAPSFHLAGQTSPGCAAVYANWPTIPQLYINGEFIGGSDIMTEMFQSGELQKLVKA